jgi:hypothetical protein
LLTRNNLGKRRQVDDKSCVFCSDEESINHLFFECVVSKQAWVVVSEVVGFQMGANYESMAKCWLCNKKYVVINMLSSAVCWSLICFWEANWLSMKALWQRVVLMKAMAGYESVCSSLEKLAARPGMLLDHVVAVPRVEQQDGGSSAPLDS